MLGYLCALAFLIGWNYLCRQFGERRNKIFLYGAAVFMTLFYGLRGINVGSDTISYYYLFIEEGSHPAEGLWKFMWEKKSPAYILAEWLFYRVLPYPQMWLLATSAFFFFPLSSFLEKNSSDPFYSYIIFFTTFGTFQMTGVRQSCAMVILFFAYEQIKKENLIKYLLLIGLAYLFHKSSVVFLPFYFISKHRITKWDIPLLAMALVVIYPNRGEIFDYIKAFTSYDYFDQLNHSEPINFSLMIYGATLLALVLCIVLRYRKQQQLLVQYDDETFLQSPEGIKLLKTGTRKTVIDGLVRKGLHDDAELTLYCQYTDAMILGSLFMPLVAVNGSVRRIVMYFSFFMILLIPKAFNEILDERSRGIVKLALASFLAYLMLRGIGSSSYAYYLCF